MESPGKVEMAVSPTQWGRTPEHWALFWRGQRRL